MVWDSCARVVPLREIVCEGESNPGPDSDRLMDSCSGEPAWVGANAGEMAHAVLGARTAPGAQADGADCCGKSGGKVSELRVSGWLPRLTRAIGLGLSVLVWLRKVG